MKTKTINITIPIHYTDERNCYAAFLMGISALIEQRNLKTLLDDPKKREMAKERIPQLTEAIDVLKNHKP
jgi:hypothetical protein